MSDQSSATTNPPSPPILCKMGCGFFGNETTGGCCSKCWRDAQTRQKKDVDGDTSSTDETAAVRMDAESTKPVPMDVESPQEEVESTATVPATAPKKKKKKKTSYKNMMAGMMEGSKLGSPRDVQKEKEELRKVTGGGAFAKIKKI